MQFTRIRIRNYKGIRDMEIREIENALILVGKNNTGKSSVLDAIRTVSGASRPAPPDFNAQRQNIEIEVTLEIGREDRELLCRMGRVSRYKRFEVWEREFYRRLPSCRGDQLTFTYLANYGGTLRYADGVRKDNPYIPEVLPRVYDIDSTRSLKRFQRDLLLFYDNPAMSQASAACCIFDTGKECAHCFQCIGLIDQKRPADLNAAEARKLLEYKLLESRIGDRVERINENFHKNGGYDELSYEICADPEQMFSIRLRTSRDGEPPASVPMSRGMQSIYMLSLLETYVEGEHQAASVIIVEYPELFLHPQLQKTASGILYRLSRKNQILFSTHSAQLLMNFTSRQIRQVVLDEDKRPVIREHASIGGILEDLGYGAGDVLNVDFVFIVEGKQDKSRLPLLLEKYYSEVYDEKGRLSRIAILTTNSCTNIKTYANLKYMNQMSFRDHFLMIRDGDGKDPEELAASLCRYYEEQDQRDADRLPRVQRKNVLILKYYSFENYFLNPAVMAELGIVESEEQFYAILWEKWEEYLNRLASGRRFVQALGRPLSSAEDLRGQMELFKIHLRGHNLYDIFYGRYKKQEAELLRRYIDLAPREDFADILDAVDAFLYFDSRKKCREDRCNSEENSYNRV